MIGVNPQSMKNDIASVRPGGYFIYDNTKRLHEDFFREDIHLIGIPMMAVSMENYDQPRLQQLFKNIIYIGALATLIDLDLVDVKNIIAEQLSKRPRLPPPNHLALDLRAHDVNEHYSDPLDVR